MNTASPDGQAVLDPREVRYLVLRKVGPHLRQYLLERFKADASVAAIKVASEILIQTGARDTFPLSVRCSIFNNAMIVRALNEHGLPATPDITRQWERECGAWGIGIGYDGKTLPGRWPGHLVAIIDRRYLWDLTIDQANRPERGIVFSEPVVLPVNEEFLRGRRQLVAPWNDLLLMYDAFPGDKSFRQSNEWTHLEGETVMSASRAVREAVNAVAPKPAPSGLAGQLATISQVASNKGSV